MSILRHNPQVDANQREIIAALRAVGASVVVLKNVGGGVPDLLVGKGREMVLMEVKRPGGNLNEKQREFHADWRGRRPVVVVDVDSALAALADMVSGVD